MAKLCKKAFICQLEEFNFCFERMIDFKELYNNIKLRNSKILSEDLSDENWLNDFKTNYDYIVVGASFDPQRFENIESAKQALDFLITKLKVKDIRFWVRWNIVGDIIDLDFYNPFFEILVKYNVTLCLNLGPIKTARWPEIHLPQKYEKDLNQLSKFPKTANPNSEIFKTGLEYLDRLCLKLSNDFPNLIKITKIVQANNEAFNPFGIPKILLPLEFELQSQKIIKKYFKDSDVLNNSAGRYQLNQLLNVSKIVDYKCVFGFDYYYLIPANNYFLLNYLEAFSFGFPFNPSINYFLRRINNTKHYFEFTEVQIEKWGKVTKTANNIQNIKYVFSRLAPYKPHSQKNLVLRLWGVEDLIKEYFRNSKEHIRIVDLISKIN
jgi:hypothetical protein